MPYFFDCLKFTPFSRSFKFTPFPPFFSPSPYSLLSAVVPRQWDSHTEQNLQTAAKERQKSVDLRERIDKFIKDSDLQMLTQENASEDAFNARIAEYNEARRVADQQLTKVCLCVCVCVCVCVLCCVVL